MLMSNGMLIKIIEQLQNKSGLHYSNTYASLNEHVIEWKSLCINWPVHLVDKLLQLVE